MKRKGKRGHGSTDMARTSSRQRSPYPHGEFLAQFHDVLVILLLIATGISAGLWLFERASALPYEAMAICAVVLLQLSWATCRSHERRKRWRRCADVSHYANVIRDGAPGRASRPGQPPGDVILIEAGDTVPADARLIESNALQPRYKRIN